MQRHLVIQANERGIRRQRQMQLKNAVGILGHIEYRHIDQKVLARPNI